MTGPCEEVMTSIIFNKKLTRVLHLAMQNGCMGQVFHVIN